MKLRIALLIVMTLTPALLVVGCSSSSSVATQPDTTPPLAPVILGARGADGILGVWWNEGNEPDLNGYNVYVTMGGIVTRLNNGPITENRYSAVVNTQGSVSVYVTAVDFSGNESSPSATQVVRMTGDQIEGLHDAVGDIKDAHF